MLPLNLVEMVKICSDSHLSQRLVAQQTDKCHWEEGKAGILDSGPGLYYLELFRFRAMIRGARLLQLKQSLMSWVRV